MKFVVLIDLYAGHIKTKWYSYSKTFILPYYMINKFYFLLQHTVIILEVRTGDIIVVNRV
jgi:hypothetical protein